MTHKALVYKNYGNPLNVFELIEEEIPKLIESTDVLVRVYASALNPADLKHCEGELRFLVQRPMPVHVGFDFSGVIENLGEESKKLGFDVGDEVYGMTKGLRNGSVAEYLVVDSNILSKKPKNITHVQAASIPLCGLTAYQCFLEAKLKPFSINDTGESDAEVAITAGAGGVGTLAIQIAKNMFRVKRVVTSGSEGKKEILIKLGADDVVNYKEESLAQRFAKDPDHKFDAILDTNNEVSTLLPFVKTSGGIVSVANPPTQKMLLNWVNSMGNHGASISGIISGVVRNFPGTVELFTGALWTQHKASRYGAHYGFIITTASGKDLDVISEFIVAERIVPVIDSIYSFENWKSAIERLYSGRATGKVVISIFDPKSGSNLS